MNERLWSPQMRKWARDAHHHGIDIGLIKHMPSRTQREAGPAGDGGGGGTPAGPLNGYVTEDGFSFYIATFDPSFGNMTFYVTEAG